MSLRALLVLVVLLGAVAFGLVRLRGKTEAPPPAEDAPLLAEFSEASVRGIEVRCADTSYVLSRAGASWRVTSSADAAADPRQVRVLVGALREARIRKALGAETAQLSGFGLDPAECRVVLGLDGEPAGRTLAIGRTSPVGMDRYAHAGDRAVVLVDGALHTAVARPASAFVERRLLPLEPDDVTSLVIERPDATVSLALDGAEWRLVAPVRDLADGGQAAAAIRAAVTLEVDEAGRGTPPADTVRSRRIALRARGTGAEHTLEAFVAAAGVAGRRFAWRADGSLLGAVGEHEIADLLRPAGAFRDRRVMSFSTPDVTRVTIARGTTTITLERAAEGAPWSVREGSAEARPAEGGHVEALLGRLRDVRALETDDGDEPAGRTGEIVVAGASGEMARARWGAAPPREGAESVWVTTPARPGAVFHVPASSFGPIPASAGELAATP